MGMAAYVLESEGTCTITIAAATTAITAPPPREVGPRSESTPVTQQLRCRQVMVSALQLALPWFISLRWEHAAQLEMTGHKAEDGLGANTITIRARERHTRI